MAELSIAQSIVNPFDSIRHQDEDGEFWLARELMPLLGYPRWNEFFKAIERAEISCKTLEGSSNIHFRVITNLVKLPQGGSNRKIDYRLTRYACYLVAMNGDPRKPEVAAAQSYFAVKTREAETAIAPTPPQRDPIEYVAAAKTVEGLRDPLMRSLLSQRIYEVLQGQPALPGTSERLVCVAVRAGELGFRLGVGEDSALGKYIRARFQPEGQLPHGRYQVNAYKLTPLLDEAIRGFFYALNGED